MKILLIQDYLRSGGTERQTLFLARAFRRAGQEAAVLTFRPGGKLAQGQEDLLLAPLQLFDLGLDWFAPGLMARVRSYAPDVIMSMGRMANCYAGALQRRFPKVAVVATVRTGKPLPLLYRRSLCQVRHVIANSHETAQAVTTAHGVPAERVSTIHNSLVFNLSLQDAGRREEAGLRGGAGAHLDTVVLLNVAMFRREKNQKDLLQMAARLPSALKWQLWLVGEGDQYEACRRQSESLGLTERVRFFGFQENPAPFYRAADLAVHASARESLSNFLIEAQAHGLPAVAFDVQGVRECLVPGETGTVVPFGDVHSLTQACQELILDRERRQRWGTRAREHARQQFSPEKQAEAYLQRLRSVLIR